MDCIKRGNLLELGKSNGKKLSRTVFPTKLTDAEGSSVLSFRILSLSSLYLEAPRRPKSSSRVGGLLGAIFSVTSLRHAERENFRRKTVPECLLDNNAPISGKASNKEAMRITAEISVVFALIPQIL